MLDNPSTQAAEAKEEGRVPSARRTRWLETARPGDRRRHPRGRTVTAQDNVLVSVLTHNQNPIHLDVEFSATTAGGRPLAESAVSIGIAIGLADPDVCLDDLVDVQIRGVEHLAPVVAGDSLTATSEVTEVAASPSRRRVVRTLAHNQRGEEVVRFERVLDTPPRGLSTQRRQDGGPVQQNRERTHDERTNFGRYLEEFRVGEVYRHWPGRTITEFDDTWFSLLTMNQHPLHIDEAYSSGTEHGQRLVNGLLVMATAVGMSVPAVSGKAIANLGYESVTHEGPTFHGDTIYADTTVLDVRRSRSKPDRGIVHVETRVRNQRGEQIMTLRRKVLVPTREAAEGASAGAAAEGSQG